MRVYIDEEYGWKLWVWTYPGTPEELVADWKAGRVPALGYLQKSGGFRSLSLERLEEPKCGNGPWAGEEEEAEWYEAMRAEWDRIMGTMDAFCHLHEEDDSWLKIGPGGEVLRWPFQSVEEEHLDACVCGTEYGPWDR